MSAPRKKKAAPRKDSPRTPPARALPFLAPTTGRTTIPVTLLTSATLAQWLKKSARSIRQRAEDAGFKARPGQCLVLYDQHGAVTGIVAGVNAPLRVFDLADVSDTLSRTLDAALLKNKTFSLENIADTDITAACLGWGLASYRFNRYRKTSSAVSPVLAWPPGADRKSITAHLESAMLVRDLINIPANDMGPDQLESAARDLASDLGMRVRVIHDSDLLKQNFPMIHAVGRGSNRRPRLIDMQWGDANHPRLTLVGKGVCFDTGGLDIKPSAFMYTMKKDMGGAAHVLGLAALIVRHKLPVRLRVLIPAVENAISGDSFRPSDILKSRKGLTVEVGDTDAEGRLVLADAMTLACEEKPDLLMDFATLTGAARVALGADLPAVFSNDEKIAFALRDHGMRLDDPLWPLPLWAGYRKDIASDIADTNSVGGKAGAITAALFLEQFVTEKVDWVHIDLYAWSDAARPGRAKGGTDMTCRAVFSYLQDRYGKNRKKKRV